MMASNGICGQSFPNNMETRSKITLTLWPVFMIMRHRTGNFAGMTAYTFRSISSDKLIHSYPFHLMSFCLLKCCDAINGHILGSVSVLIAILGLRSNYCAAIYAAFIN